MSRQLLAQASFPPSRRAVLIGTAATFAARLTAQSGSQFDRFGGFRRLRLPGAKYFRIAKVGEREILVTPEGHGTVALGVNHLAALAQCSQHPFVKRHRGHWQDYATSLISQLNSWGFNNAGYGGPAELQNRLPYFAAITLAPVEKHRSHPVPDHPNSYQFPDVFDPAWQRRLDEKIAAECAPHRENPFLVGYFWTDTPTWDLIKTRGLRGTEWVSAIRALAPNSPGRTRYAAFLRERWEGRLPELNQIYGLALGSLDELATADLGSVAVGRHVVQEDDHAFLGLIARHYYQAAGSAQRRHDPNHLVFGERYLAGDAPEEVLREAAPHIDAVAVQPGDRYSELYPSSVEFPEQQIAEMRRITGKPVLICDHNISFPTAREPRTIFEQLPTEQEAAAAVERFVARAARTPFMLGYLKCQYVNRPAGFGRGLRQGLVDETGIPYRQLVAAYTRAFRAWKRKIEEIRT